MPTFRYRPVVQALPHHRAVARQCSGGIHYRLVIIYIFLKRQRPDAPADSFRPARLCAAHFLARTHSARHGQVDILRPQLRRDKVLWHVPGVGLEPTRFFRARDLKSLASTNSATPACFIFLPQNGRLAIRPRSQVVRRFSAKEVCAGAIPAVASTVRKKARRGDGGSYRPRLSQTQTWGCAYLWCASLKTFPIRRGCGWQTQAP